MHGYLSEGYTTQAISHFRNFGILVTDRKTVKRITERLRAQLLFLLRKGETNNGFIQQSVRR
jgi:hypothetical protein